MDKREIQSIAEHSSLISGRSEGEKRECAGNVLWSTGKEERWGNSDGGWMPGVKGRVKLFVLHVQTALRAQERLAGAVGALALQALRGL